MPRGREFPVDRISARVLTASGLGCKPYCALKRGSESSCRAGITPAPLPSSF